MKKKKTQENPNDQHKDKERQGHGFVKCIQTTNKELDQTKSAIFIQFELIADCTDALSQSRQPCPWQSSCEARNLPAQSPPS